MLWRRAATSTLPLIEWGYMWLAPLFRGMSGAGSSYGQPWNIRAPIETNYYQYCC